VGDGRRGGGPFPSAVGRAAAAASKRRAAACSSLYPAPTHRLAPPRSEPEPELELELELELEEESSSEEEPDEEEEDEEESSELELDVPSSELVESSEPPPQKRLVASGSVAMVVAGKGYAGVVLSAAARKGERKGDAAQARSEWASAQAYAFSCFLCFDATHGDRGY